MTAELENKSRQEALDALEGAKKFAATKNQKDPTQILQVIEKLESEDVRNKMTAVDPNIQDEYRGMLYTWNDAYLSLCRSEWRLAKRAASNALRIQDYEKAVAALDNYPEVLRTRAHEYGDDLQRYKEAIEKFKESPAQALEAIEAAEAAVAKGDYEAAIEICIRAMGRLKESNDMAALRIVANEHISVIDRWVDEIAKKQSKDAALTKLEELCSTVASRDHDFYMEDKRRELGSR
jgi:tetratricopeptide (TPR) repeat protein